MRLLGRVLQALFAPKPWPTGDLSPRVVCRGCQRQVRDGRNPPEFVIDCTHCRTAESVAA